MKSILLILLVIWNVIVFLTYALDKWKAVHQRWRIPEKVLLTMSLCGAGLGALLAGKIVHHKTKKWYFWLVWILGIVIEVAVIYGIIVYFD